MSKHEKYIAIDYNGVIHNADWEKGAGFCYGACSCGWEGETHYSRVTALHDTREHILRVKAITKLVEKTKK